jgi:hypothetical protein
VIFRGMFVKIEYHMRIAGQFPDILWITGVESQKERKR